MGLDTSDSHNVTLTKGPKSLKKKDKKNFSSADRLDRIKFKRHLQEEGHLHVHLHDPPDDDARDRQGQESEAPGGGP